MRKYEGEKERELKKLIEKVSTFNTYLKSKCQEIRDFLQQQKAMILKR